MVNGSSFIGEPEKGESQMCSAETPPPATDRSAEPQTPEGIADDPLQKLLVKLAQFPELRDRLIFDPIGLMSEAHLAPDDQDLLLSGDVDAINARVWPEGRPPRNGPLVEIEIVDSDHGRMPLVRAIHPYVIRTTQPDPQTFVSGTQLLSSFMGSVAMPAPPRVPTLAGPPPGTAPTYPPVESNPAAPAPFAGASVDPRRWPNPVIYPR